MQTTLAVADGLFFLIVAPLAACGVLAILIFFVAFWIRGSRDQVEFDRAERAKSELCLECGYDIRASPDRCPECGTKVSEDEDESEFDPKKLRDDWPLDPIKLRIPEMSETPVAAFETYDAMLADLLAQHLVAYGIQCSVKVKKESRRSGAMTYSVLSRLLIVMSGDNELAQDLIDRFRRKPNRIKPFHN